MLIVLTVLFALSCLGGMIATSLLVAKAEREHPATGQFVEIEGAKQHYITRGSRAAPPIVLVHGAFGASQDFENTILDELASRYFCLAWDRPGHGYSQRPEGVVDPAVQARMLVALIRELDLDQPLLVGFSYGGAVVLTAALVDPDAMRGVVMLNGPSHTWPDPIDLEYRLPSIPVVGPLAVATITTPLGALLASKSVEAAFAPEPVAPEFADSPLSLSIRPNSYRANAEDVVTLQPFLAEQAPRYPELGVPITMLVSEGDTVVSPTIHSLQLKEQAPKFSMRRLEGAGHQVLYSRPDTVIGVIDGAMR